MLKVSQYHPEMYHGGRYNCCCRNKVFKQASAVSSCNHTLFTIAVAYGNPHRYYARPGTHSCVPPVSLKPPPPLSLTNFEHERRPSFLRLANSVDGGMSKAAAIDLRLVRFLRGIFFNASSRGSR